MSKSLVIVESPAKVKTINKFLGSKFIVKSSVGHIRDLASATGTETGTTTKKKASSKKMTPEQKEAVAYQRLVARMGVDPHDQWAANYAMVTGKEKVLKTLKDAAEKVDTIYLATDLDREGEAIAWHLMESIGGDPSRYKRVTFTEITEKAIKEAFETPGELNYSRVNAQQARRFLDRVVGYMLSPLLWAKIARGLSAGRVQSVAVRLIAEREKQIHAFLPDEYWEVHADYKHDNSLRLQVSKQAGKAFKPVNTAQAQEAVQKIKQSQSQVLKVEKSPARSKPSAPFITSTLQQAASTRLGYGVKKTMVLAQQLYEAGFISYMRTDSTNLSADAVTACREFIQTKFGGKYLPDAPLSYSSKKSAQEAHEAIRPTDLLKQPHDMTSLDKDARQLYEIIWRQFVACQMTQAEYDATVVTVKCDDLELRVRGKVLRFDGFLKVMPQTKKSDEDLVLPDVQEGEVLQLLSVEPKQHFTKPPPRFTEASLVRELEKKGIGRPSTYASIISTIQERGYVRVDRRRFFCLKMGEIVTDRLFENFEDLMDYGFTASMEAHLDGIAQGQEDWRRVLDDFYGNFSEKLTAANESMRGNEPTPTDIGCPECSRHMCIRTARTGVFLSCSGYALPPKERCKGTINLVSGDEFQAYSDDDDEGSVGEIQGRKRCVKCETVMDSYVVDEARKLHICGNNPDCDGVEIEAGKFRVKGYEGPIITCDKCSSDMQLKTGRFGKYFGCTGSDCKNTRKLLKNGEAAPPRMDPIHMKELSCEKSDGYFVLRDGAAGLFLASSKFPKSRETKKPRVLDLVRHKDDLDPKYHYILSAPIQDPEGHESLIRFSRKTKEHFISSDDSKGKATSWSLYWIDEKWSETKPD
ncbi:MAG: type I DNA topoisomerase [Oligoflexales bacterium]